MPRKAKRSKNRGADLKSSSFTEPVVRILSSKAKGKSVRNFQIKPGQVAGTRPRLLVFHKIKDKTDVADILGTRNLSGWRGSSGHNKSWKTCKRLKVTRDYLELLTSSNGHSVSFGWQFSTMNTPTSFVRSRGLYVNKQPRVRRAKTLPSVPLSKDLDEEYNSNWPLPKGTSHRYESIHRNLRSQVAPGGLPKIFLRLNITCETVSAIVEAPIEEIRLATCQSLQLPNTERQADIVVERLVVLDLIRNDSHADVYLVRDPNNSSQPYHAHAFLSEGLSKNDSSFRRRKVGRLRKSHDFYAETVQLGRQIIIMKADQKADNTFHVKITQQEFPSLPGIVVKPRETRQTKHRRSYAAVVGRRGPSKKVTISNHLAYRAWQERHGIRSPKKAHIVTPSNITNLPAAELEGITASFKWREVPNIPVANRFAILSGVGVCEG